MPSENRGGDLMPEEESLLPFWRVKKTEVLWQTHSVCKSCPGQEVPELLTLEPEITGGSIVCAYLVEIVLSCLGPNGWWSGVALKICCFKLVIYCRREGYSRLGHRLGGGVKLCVFLHHWFFWHDDLTAPVVWPPSVWLRAWQDSLRITASEGVTAVPFCQKLHPP